MLKSLVNSNSEEALQMLKALTVSEGRKPLPANDEEEDDREESQVLIT